MQGEVQPDSGLNETNIENTAVNTAIDIVVTAPSSPDGRAAADDFPCYTGTARAHVPITSSPNGGCHDILSSLCAPMSHLQEPSRPNVQEGLSRFEEIMASAQLPDSGPAHFEARRALWRKASSLPPARTEQPAKLVELLEQDGPLDGDGAWNRGVDRIWKGVTGGGRLKRRLPMRYLVRTSSLLAISPADLILCSDQGPARWMDEGWHMAQRLRRTRAR